MGTKNSTKHLTKTPGHLWFVGIVLTFISLIGAYDYFMVHGNNIEYLNSINTNRDIVAYFADYPLVLTIFWIANIFSGLGAAILLLLRSKQAVWFSFFAVIAMLFLDVSTFVFRNRLDIFGLSVSLVDLMILAITIWFFFYCKMLLKLGVLK